ncbi:hypothetical protein [Pseudochryseolinea flava]|nr:hypothetical protein [Pseudochryseolinea flava]
MVFDSVLVKADDSLTTIVDSEQLPEGLLFKDNETFFKALVEKKFVAGELIDITFITENLVSVEEGESAQLSVALIQSGEGEYVGGREGIQYATVHCMLVVFKKVGEEQVFRDFVSLGDVESQGLVSGSIEGEEIKITDDNAAVLIHFKSSEEGAGDYGFRKDDASLYVFVKSKLTSVLEMTLEDYQFSSDEHGDYSERSSVTEIKVLDSKSNGLYDISLHTTVNVSVTKDEESYDGNDAIEEAPVDPITYRWDGVKYQSN